MLQWLHAYLHKLLEWLSNYLKVHHQSTPLPIKKKKKKTISNCPEIEKKIVHFPPKSPLFESEIIDI
jgi:hypothetical protein